MSIVQSVILSIIEGITEFLPVSSTGHLILAGKILGLTQTEFVKSFEIFIQLGAILSIVFLYRKSLIFDISVWKKILAAFIPTALVGFVFYKVIKNILLDSWLITVVTLFIGGILILMLEKLLKSKKAKYSKISQLTYKKATTLGLIQSLSVIPGVSRAGATIFGGMILGMERATAVEASFLLAIPTMFAATSWDLVKSNFNFTASEVLLLLIGFTASFITSYLTAKYLLQFIRSHNFVGLGIYRILLAILYFVIFVK